MIRKTQCRDHIINLDGPEGNAFLLLARAKQLSERLNMDFTTISEEMRNGDYINLLRVFEDHFGDYVIFETENKHYLTALGIHEKVPAISI